MGNLSVFPAPAGMNRGRERGARGGGRVPRARGDEPAWDGKRDAKHPCSPRPRG